MTDAAVDQGVTERDGRPALLRIDDARFAYRDRPALKGVSLDVHPREIVVLLGPNGAGKSTLVKAISGRLPLDGGSVRIARRDPAKDRRARRLTGLVPQQIALYEKLTATENLTAFARLMGVTARDIPPVADQVLQLVRLQDRRDDRALTLSGGMLRRLNIAAALMHKPRLLVLDEPTVGVDVKARGNLISLLRTLRDKGLALLLTTHDMEEAEALADRVAIIVDGEVQAQGRPDELVEQAFGKRKLITIVFDPESASSEETRINEALSSAGLHRMAPRNRWTGLIDGDDAEITDRMERLLADNPTAREIRVRKPGLDSLLARYTDPRAD